MSDYERIIKILQGNISEWNEEIKRSRDAVKRSEAQCNYANYKKNLQRIEEYENMIAETQKQIKCTTFSLENKK